MFKWRSQFSDVIPHQIHKRTKYICYKNSWYRCFSYYFLQHAKTLSRFENMTGSWFNLNNTLCYLNLNKTYQSLGYTLCHALPSYHAFTGCNFTTLFSCKVKVNFWKELSKNAIVIKVFHELNEKETVDKKQMQDIEKFVKCTGRNN